MNHYPQHIASIPAIEGDANQVRRVVLFTIPVSESRTGPYNPGLDPRRHQRLEDLVQTLAGVFVRRRDGQGTPVTAQDFLKHLNLDALRELMIEVAELAQKSDDTEPRNELLALVAHFRAIREDGAETGIPPEAVHGFIVMRLVRALTSMLAARLR